MVAAPSCWWPWGLWRAAAATRPVCSDGLQSSRPRWRGSVPQRHQGMRRGARSRWTSSCWSRTTGRCGPSLASKSPPQCVPCPCAWCARCAPHCAGRRTALQQETAVAPRSLAPSPHTRARARAHTCVPMNARHTHRPSKPTNRMSQDFNTLAPMANAAYAQSRGFKFHFGAFAVTTPGRTVNRLEPHATLAPHPSHDSARLQRSRWKRGCGNTCQLRSSPPLTHGAPRAWPNGRRNDAAPRRRGAPRGLAQGRRANGRAASWSIATHHPPAHPCGKAWGGRGVVRDSTRRRASGV